MVNYFPFNLFLFMLCRKVVFQTSIMYVHIKLRLLNFPQNHPF